MSTTHKKSKFAKVDANDAVHHVSDDGEIIDGDVGDIAQLRSATDRKVLVSVKVARVMKTESGARMFRGEIVRFLSPDDETSFDGMATGDHAEFDIVQVAGWHRSTFN